MSSGFNQIDPHVLKFIFNEDIYLVKDKHLSPVANATKTPSAEPVIIPAPEKTQPVITQEKPVSQKLRKVAVVAGTEKEIELHREFLSKILLAVGINWEEAGFIAFDKKTDDTFENYLIFGIENQKLVDFKSPIFLNQVQTQADVKYIFTYSLNDLEKSKDKKKGLWTAMQEAFLKK